ncbi:MAG: hypothetical protein AAF360_13185, partial [Pseudomonadota bacterium]
PRSPKMAGTAIDVVMIAPGGVRSERRVGTKIPFGTLTRLESNSRIASIRALAIIAPESQIIMTTKKVDIEVSFQDEEIDFLKKNAQAFELPSEGKALRCCVNWARNTQPSLNIIPTSSPSSTLQIEVADTQIDYLKSVSADLSLAARAIVVAAMELDDPATVFKVVRCHQPSVCPEG